MRSMNFSRNLCQLRRAKKITQEKMAEICGVSRQAVTKWESGSSLPDLYKLSDIAEVLEVTTDELLFGDHSDENAEIVHQIETIAKRLKEFDGCLNSLVEHSEEVLENDEDAGMFLVDTFLKSGVYDREWISDKDQYLPLSEMFYEEEDLENAITCLELGLVSGSLDCGYSLLARKGELLQEIDDKFFDAENYDSDYFNSVKEQLFWIKGYIRLMEDICEFRTENEELSQGEYTSETFHKYLKERY